MRTEIKRKKEKSTKRRNRSKKKDKKDLERDHRQIVLEFKKIKKRK